MSTKLKIIILLLFLVQGAVFYWTYSDKKTALEIELLPYKSYLENPLTVINMDLSDQGLEAVIIDFSQFTNLEYLDLSNNLLEEVPAEILKLPKLQTLLVNNNELYLSESIELSENSSIEKLDLRQNFLYDDFNATCFACFKNLKYLDLSFNSLNEIPDLSKTKLDTILLNNNTIINNSNIVAYLPENHIIEYLDLSNNEHPFKWDFENSLMILSKKCRSINLSNNDLSFPYRMFELGGTNQLKSVNLSTCDFVVTLETLAENTIDTLDLSGNHMFLSGNPFQACKNLKYLDISGSNFYDFELMSLTLEYLSIDIKEASSFFLPNLETLSIDGSLGGDLDIFFELGIDSGYFKDLELPNLKMIKIRNYEENALEKILKKEFPNVEIVIESYKDNI